MPKGFVFDIVSSSINPSRDDIALGAEIRFQVHARRKDSGEMHALLLVSQISVQIDEGLRLRLSTHELVISGIAHSNFGGNNALGRAEVVYNATQMAGQITVSG